MKAFEELYSSTKKDIIIDNFMRSKGVYLLVSKPKVGKSLFALQLANSFANGIPFLNHDILKPSPVLYITTELNGSQLKDRCDLLKINFDKNKFFVIDRDEKQSINMMEIEYQIKEFAEKYGGKLLILDMLKDINFGIAYDINNYQDIAQKLMPKLRSYADKYNLTILFVHHLNKLGKTLGSTGFDAVVDGIIRLSKNSFEESSIKFEMINRDFPEEKLYLNKNKNQVFSIAEDSSLDYVNPNIIGFIKYAIREKEFDFIVSDIINKANLMCTPTQLGKLISTHKEMLKKEGLHISKYRTNEGRTYHVKYEEPSLEDK